VSWVLKIHPESVKPIAEEERKDGKHRGNGNDDPYETVLLELLLGTKFIVER
jgi:hypothetical protein